MVELALEWVIHKAPRPSAQSLFSPVPVAQPSLCPSCSSVTEGHFVALPGYPLGLGTCPGQGPFGTRLGEGLHLKECVPVCGRELGASLSAQLWGSETRNPVPPQPLAILTITLNPNQRRATWPGHVWAGALSRPVLLEREGLGS